MLSTGKIKKEVWSSSKNQILFITETVESWIVKDTFKQWFLLYFNLWEPLRIPSIESQKKHSLLIAKWWELNERPLRGLRVQNILSTVCQVNSPSCAAPPCFSRNLNCSRNVVLLAFSNMECIKRKPINKCSHMLMRKKADTSNWSICQHRGEGTGKTEKEGSGSRKWLGQPAFALYFLDVLGKVLWVGATPLEMQEERTQKNALGGCNSRWEKSVSFFPTVWKSQERKWKCTLI